MKKKNNPLIYILAILVVILLVSNTYVYNYGQNKISVGRAESIEFMKDYTTAVINIHVAINNINLANANLIRTNEYVQGEYVYEYAKDVYGLGKDQINDAKQYLLKARDRLERIENNAPNEFFKVDVSNRLRQVEILISISDLTYSLLDNSEKQIYEVNYGSTLKAEDYLDEYNNVLVPQSNDKFRELSDIQNEIDKHWDQNWYPTFRG